MTVKKARGKQYSLVVPYLARGLPSSKEVSGGVWSPEDLILGPNIGMVEVFSSPNSQHF